MFSSEYFKVDELKGISQFQNMIAYMGGSAVQTVIDNPVTSYRQLIQQYATDLKGNTVDPKIARQEANAVFKRSPISASMSGLGPRLVGVGFKRVPKFGFLLGISYFMDEKELGLIAATGASLFSAPFINPIRMIEKQQRAYFKQTGSSKRIIEILKESSVKNYMPLFRGTVPLMGHSLASATTGLVGQPKLQKFIENELGSKTGLGKFTCNLLSSTIVSPIYIIMTNPLSRLEVIMQTSSIKGQSVNLKEAIGQVIKDSKEYGLRGIFRGQGVGIMKAIISLTIFHEARLFFTERFKEQNRC